MRSGRGSVPPFSCYIGKAGQGLSGFGKQVCSAGYAWTTTFPVILG